MGKKPFINKKNARHFQVVHRSMRDPKIYDEDASAFVLKPLSDASNKPDHHSDTNDYSHDLEDPVPFAESKAGTAALYGIYFDDREYDYLKHLKPMGNEPGSVFLAAASSQKPPPNRKHPIQFIPDLPIEAQASMTELPFDPVAMTSADGNIGIGLHLSEEVREVLYALDDDAYVDDTDDRYFDNLAKAELDEECLQLVNQAETAKHQADTFPKVLDWTMAARIKDIQSSSCSDEEEEEEENELDSICDLPELNLTKKKKKPNFRDVESMRSITSSILSRTSHLELLDDQFDQMIMREYGDDDIGPGEQHILEDLSPEQAEHVDELLQEFLDKVHVTTHNTSQENLRVQGGGVGQYDTMRRMLRVDEFGNPLPRVNLAKYAYERINPVDETTMPKPMIIEDKYVDRWDCESVLSRYSNTENRPQVISDRGQRRRRRCAECPSSIQSMLKEHDQLAEAQIKLSARTGLPKKTCHEPIQEEEKDDEDLVDVVNEGAARPKYEGADEKRARKRLVKESRRERRMAKQEIKHAFKAEAEKQVRDSLLRKTHTKSILV